MISPDRELDPESEQSAGNEVSTVALITPLSVKVDVGCEKWTCY
jgi:hypothetical protein